MSRLIHVHALAGDRFTFTPVFAEVFTITRQEKDGSRTFEVQATPDSPLLVQRDDLVVTDDKSGAFDGLIALGQAKEVTAPSAE